MWGAAIVVVVAGLAWWSTREAPSQVLYRAGRELQARGVDVPPMVVERLGVLLGASGRPREAIAVLERGIARAPAEPGLQLNLAVALAQEGRMADARARVADALRLRADYPQAKALAERLGH